MMGMIALTLGSAKPPSSGHMTPEQIMSRAFDNYQTIRSYQCRLILHATKGEAVQDSQYLFYYQKPNMVRMHVKEGKGKGDTALMRSDGTVRGRREGILSMVAITLNPEDERLRDLWGQRFHKTDWGTILKETEKRMNEHASRRVELAPGGKGYILTIEGKDGYLEQTWLEKDSLTLTKKQVLLTNGDRLEATWTDVALNPQFVKDFFDF
jgi:outer membrane lipoprotein-sorting protein